MTRNFIAAAAMAVALSISATGLAQSKQGMQNGRHLGWNKQDKRNDKRNDKRYDQNRRNDDRWDNRNDGRYNNGYNNNGSRYDSSRYGNQGTYQRREQTKNEWKNIAMGAGAIALIGLLQKDNRLVFGGAAGALYSLYRYEQDRKSQSGLDRARSRYFDNEYFYRDGVRFDRRLVTQGGQRYYQFVRSR
jgi:hypothetical protein